jgi:hypothetical protein
MSDNELTTMVRESVADVHSATPVAQIISRGSTLRARRRLSGAAAAALVVAAGSALAVTMLLPSGQPGLVSARHPGSRPAPARLAAWTVAMQANGDIDVTINQLKDPAGLQATLRADGLPVTVSFSGQLSLPPSCQPYSSGLSTMNSVTQIRGDELVIDPSALPSGAGLAIFDEPGAGVPVLSGNVPTHGGTPPVRPSLPPLLTDLNGPLAIGMVYASPACTG